MPAARADLMSERFDAIRAGATDSRKFAPATVSQRLTHAFADDVARANQTPGDRGQGGISKVLRF
jgi:hypothetical protein